MRRMASLDLDSANILTLIACSMINYKGRQISNLVMNSDIHANFENYEENGNGLVSDSLIISY
jgi:hypothetical protein